MKEIGSRANLKEKVIIPYIILGIPLTFHQQNNSRTEAFLKLKEKIQALL